MLIEPVILLHGLCGYVAPQISQYGWIQTLGSSQVVGFDGYHQGPWKDFRFSAWLNASKKSVATVAGSDQLTFSQ